MKHFIFLDYVLPENSVPAPAGTKQSQDAEISRRLDACVKSEKRTDWNMAYPKAHIMPGGGRMARFWGEHEGDDHPHKEITQAIIGTAIRIQSALGPGLLKESSGLFIPGPDLFLRDPQRDLRVSAFAWFPHVPNGFHRGDTLGHRRHPSHL